MTRERMRTRLIWLGLLVSVSSTADAQFVSGRIYTPVSGGNIVEWNQDLQITRQFHVAGVTGATGATFNDSGNMVFIGLKDNFARVIEIDSSGTILRQYSTGQGSLLGGSRIDFDPATRRYALAYEHQVTILSADLTPIGSTVANFARAFGVSFAPNNTILATDQFNVLLRRFDATTLQELAPINVNAQLMTGLDVSPAGDVLMSDDWQDQVRLLAGGHLPMTTVVNGSGGLNIANVQYLDGGKFVTSDGRGVLKIYSASGVLLKTGSVDNFSEGIAYLVPSPGTLVMTLPGVSLAKRRRR